MGEKSDADNRRADFFLERGSDMLDASTPESFYVGIRKRGTILLGHAVRIGSPPAFDSPAPQYRSLSAQVVLPDATLDFKSVLRAYVSTMESYRNFIAFTVGIAPYASMLTAGHKIREFVKRRGQERPELSHDKLEVYELSLNVYREFRRCADEIDAAKAGAEHLPEVMIIGLISVYDAFLTRLLRLVLTKHDKIVLTAEKTLKYSELSQFASIEDARLSLIEGEIEAIMRSSHHDQFAFIESRLKMSVTNDLYVLPQFIELCERRNLLTHTGGIVSGQYISVCKKYGCDVSDVSIGMRRPVDASYFAKAVNITYEVGVRVCYALWRKYMKDQRDQADHMFNELCYDLIFSHDYSTAESLLSFSSSLLKTKGKQETRLMMVVNLANAKRLQGKYAEAKLLIDQEDWSAARHSFRLCAAAVKGEIDEVIGYMTTIGSHGEVVAEDYRMWPVFRGIKNDERFVKAFEQIFAEPFILPKASESPKAAPDGPLSEKKLPEDADG